MLGGRSYFLWALTRVLEMNPKAALTVFRPAARQRLWSAPPTPRGVWVFPDLLSPEPDFGKAFLDLLNPEPEVGERPS